MSGNCWLVKSEPDTFSIQDLALRPKQTEGWDGVRNYQARNYLRDGMKKGDPVLFYHSRIRQPAIVGLCSVVREGYPDASAWHRDSAHPDPKSTPENPIWYQVDLRLEIIFKGPVLLENLRKDSQMQEMALLKKGNRLSVMPVSPAHYRRIMEMAGISVLPERNQ
ncbi:putative RNA-binding protein with PUA-like domain [Desulfobotulus alkaliphilus]|uniref:Putative RNA-binding protein with PUA-like domain n=1 Tax=Desulfobotulus alkaliphilus TaxID=622671 RepID=A0A562RET6_9BACT|nr:EVE domain-containing protein [Desulfobotulus alkaliphilus]TWI66916.1 putative RNA-binding protein with PUA-like domain [Desulfobotulus alkaliphilus]